MFTKKTWIAGLAAMAIAAGMTIGAAAAEDQGAASKAVTQAEEEHGESEGSTDVSSMTTVGDLSLADGFYTMDAVLKGGTGRAHISSPALVTVEDGKAKVEIIWSSPYYDYMLVDGEKYLPVNAGSGEDSVFEVPVPGFDFEWPVTGDTVVMSEPHEIDYTVYMDSSTLMPAEEPASEGQTENGAEEVRPAGNEAAGETDLPGTENGTEAAEKTALPAAPEIEGLTYDHRMELAYAQGFSVDYYEDGFKYIQILDGDHFLIAPEGAQVPAEESLPKDTILLQQPLDHVYLAATSAMDGIASIGALDNITLSGTDTDGWYVEDAKKAMEDGKIAFAGKYSAPDYELIVSENSSLAIESTMIYHSPEIKEELEQFGIPVFVERSSYELHPLGRAEWVKLYGALFNKEEEADKIFSAMQEKAEAVIRKETEADGDASDRPTVAYFSISSNGYATVRRSDDYIAKMIELAGGKYIFQDLAGEGHRSTINMQMEDFYAGAKDADYIIYNSIIEGEIQDMDALLSKSELLADFKAVRNGNAFCMTQSAFQNTMGIADMIVDFHEMVTNPEADQLTYMYRIH